MAALGDADPEALLEWLSTGHDDQRDMQSMALEHLCMALLMSDNVDRCFEMYPPKTFIPPLCAIFLDELAPDGILEATARALTYYLDVSAECTRRILSTEGTVRAICNRLLIASLDSQTGKDLAEQCIKVLEHMSSRDLGGLLEAGALNAVLAFIRNYGYAVHKDALRSAMSVVSRLCSKIEPADGSVSGIIESLTALLKHKDSQIADSALRCFSSLADRFTRRNCDPAVLTSCGLIEILLHRLISVSQHPRISVGGTAGSSVDNNSAGNIPNTLNLLQLLVRSSPSVSQDVSMSCDLVKSVQGCLEADDRCIVEVTRLVDLLLTILFEGRTSLPKSPNCVPGRYTLRRLEGPSGSGADRLNRHLIEVIRGKDYEALVDAVENTTADVNVLDDVGQSLLNWAAAFGTQEMVEFLCEHGADPNKGQRSSSLHYAACFGRPGIAQVLLQHGADPSVKDEDGKTAFDKAKERSEEGHREMVKLLSAPQEIQLSGRKPVEKEKLAAPAVTEEKIKKGDNPALGTERIIQLLPLFAKTAVVSLNSQTRRCVTFLVKKMLGFCPADVSSDLWAKEQSQDGLIVLMIKLIALLMSSDEEEESFVLAFGITDILMSKYRDDFADSLFRAGIVGQISAMFKETGKLALPEKKLDQSTLLTIANAEVEKSAEKISLHKFGDWSLMKTGDGVWMWTDFMILKFPSVSSGWFQSCMNGRVAIIHNEDPSLDVVFPVPEDNTLNVESGNDLLDTFVKLLNTLRNDQNVTFSAISSSEALRFWSWIFTCMDARVLRIVNAQNKCELQIRYNMLDSVVFTSSEGRSRSLTSRAKVSTSPNGQEVNLALSSEDKPKAGVGHVKIQNLAHELYLKHFQQAQPSPRGPMGKLMTVVGQLDMALQKQSQQDIRRLHDEKLWTDDLRLGLRELIHVIGDGSSLSPYEIQSTNIVKMLNCVLRNDVIENPHSRDHMRAQRVEVWKSIFHQADIAARSGRTASETLIRVLVSVLECTEKLPMVVQDTSSPGNGFHALTRPVPVKMEIRGSSTQLVDRTGRKLRIEPLVTVRELELYLWKKLFKNWYDYDRLQLAFVRKIKELGSDCRLNFPYASDFDENGILYWIGTNARTVKDWVNPATTEMVAVSSCDSKSLPCGSISDFFGRSTLPAYARTSEVKEAWFAIDLGMWVEPKHYTLRHGRGSGALRNWVFQGSRDGNSWVTLKCHMNDTSLVGAGATATWRLEEASDGAVWRYYRINMSGENAEYENCVCVSGFELYGTITGVCDDLGKGFKERPRRRLRQEMHSSESFVELRSRVMRGRDWTWGNQDGDLPGVGTIVARNADDWVDVVWDNGEGHTYRMGAEGKFDLHILTSQELSAMSTVSAHFSRSLSTPVTMVSSLVINRVNRTASVGFTSGARAIRSGQNRTTSSTLSLPETTLSVDSNSAYSSVNANEQTVSTDQLHRSTEVQSGGITRSDPISQLNFFSESTRNRFWRGGISVRYRDSPEPRPSDALLSFQVDSLRSPEPTEDTLAELTDLRPYPQMADRRRNNRTRFEPRTGMSSDQSTPIGSLASLHDPSEYQTNTLNQLSVSVPDLFTPCSSHSADEVRQRVLRIASRGARHGYTSVDATRPPGSQTHLSSHDSDSSSGPLSGAQSYPMLTRQERSPDPRLASNTRTRALLRTMRSTSSDSGEFLRSIRAGSEGLDLRAALDVASQDDDLDGREGDYGGFTSLAEFALRSLQSRADRESEDQEEGSSEEEILERNVQRIGWSDEFVLKRQFSSLIPNFDPRPGRSNVSQTTELDLSLPPRTEIENLFDNKPKEESKLTLSFRGPVVAGKKVAEIFASDPDETVFSIFQRLIASADPGSKSSRGRLIWESSFTLLYGDKCAHRASTPDLNMGRNYSAILPSCCPSDPDFVYDTLSLLKVLSNLAGSPRREAELLPTDLPAISYFVDPGAFLSPKITGKIMSQMVDVVALATNTLPTWCELLMTKFPMVFPYESRRLYFLSTTFGTERAIVWLQNQREQMLEASRMVRLEGLFHDFRLGRQKHVRVKVSRQHILDWALAVMFTQARGKTVLEVEFENEEGTGLGPTLEFYALIAAELQRKDLGLWICDDDHADLSSDSGTDLGSGVKPPGYYVKSFAGLFPAPYPPEHPALGHLTNIYRFLGVVIGKALLDNRLFDLPMSRAFFKLLCENMVDISSATSSVQTSRSQTEIRDYGFFVGSGEQTGKRNRRQQRRTRKSGLRTICRAATPAWYRGILGVEHLEEVDPHRGRFLRGLMSLVKKKLLIEEDIMLNEDHKREKLKTLSFEYQTSRDKFEHIRLEDLGLTFEFSPSSRVFKYVSCDIAVDGDTVPVTIENVELYIEMTLEYCFNSGIRMQMDAIKEGIEQVFPLEKLHVFMPDELRLMLCGDQSPTWTRDDILAYTEPKLGYTQDSPSFQRFVNVLSRLNVDERKAFVRFVTGCSSLPPGGLMNLHPRLTIVRTVTRCQDEGYPSVNTCVHYLKLPEYSSEEILYQRLIAATKERGFHFN